MILLGPLLAACGSSGADEGEPIAWEAAEQPTATAPAATPPPVASAGLGGATGSPVVTHGGASLTPAQLKAMQPNELGLVPVLMYHVITTDPAQEEQFVRIADDMRADLQWLYDRDFYVISMRELITNTISAPAGKRPVVLTFDDSTSSQFRFIESSSGELVPDPDSAVGILEAFFAEHPDFGRGGHFALVPSNCFAVPDQEQLPYCEQKVRWLADQGYEVGNHTRTHANLGDLPNEEFVREVAEPMRFVNGILGDHPANVTDVLTLPYGIAPDKDLHPDQREMMRSGFWYQGEAFSVSAALLVGANPAVSPASTEWDPLWTPRIQMFDAEIAKWFGEFERGTVPLYVSDGDPATITVPSPLPAGLEDQFDATAGSAEGKSVIQYDPITGERALLPAAPVALGGRREPDGEGPA